MSGVQNCGRALERMIQCIVLAVELSPPTFTSDPPDIIHVMNAPIFRHFSTPVYYCEHKQKVKTGEVWE